jgi:catechol 2,3-dioxygenase-like lactoylglutathione lyase family enzyme
MFAISFNSKIKQPALHAVVGTLVLATTAASAQQRPPITGISHMCVYSSDLAAAEHFYADILGAKKGPDPEDPAGSRYYFSATQYAEVLPLPSGQGLNRLAHVAFNTDDTSAMRAYLGAHGNTASTPIKLGSDGSKWFETSDPEGNRIQFVQPGSTEISAANQISTRVIHIGFEVHDRATEDKFYRALLGFQPYWYGAMQPDKVDWISQQVPDGRDWLEYMMVGDGSTTPLDRVDARELGVLNHFSLGVQNMEKAVTTLYAGDRLSPRHDGPQMGRDGKWQANLYDPDGTRVELMEFQPVTKPCCSGFTAASPLK